MLTAIGALQILAVQGMELLAVESHGTTRIMEGAPYALGAGCVILGAGAGWAFRHSGRHGRWAHLEGMALIGAAMAGALATGVFAWFSPALSPSDLVDYPGTWWFLPVCAAMALAIGASTALSPTGALPALIGLVVLEVLDGEVIQFLILDAEDLWTGPLMTLGPVLLAAAAHTIGPFGDAEAPSESDVRWDDWIAGGRADAPE